MQERTAPSDAKAAPADKPGEDMFLCIKPTRNPRRHNLHFVLTATLLVASTGAPPAGSGEADWPLVVTSRPDSLLRQRQGLYEAVLRVKSQE